MVEVNHMSQRTGRGRIAAALGAIVLAAASVVIIAAPAGAVSAVTLTGGTTLTEGDPATTYIVRRTGDLTVAETITWTLTGDIADMVGPSTGDLIFAADPGTVSFQELTFDLTAFDDVDGETAEGITITLTSTDAGSTMPTPLAVALQDDGDAGTISFTQLSQTVGDGEPDVNVATSVTLQRTGGTEGAVSVTLVETSLDLTLAATTVSFANGVGTAPAVGVTVIGDDEIEGPEAPTIGLVPNTGTPVLGPSHTINITDDDDNLPVANDDPAGYATTEDVALNSLTAGDSSVLLNDTDEDTGQASLIAVIATQPANGSVVLGSDGHFVYTPDADFGGPTDTFTYQARDPQLNLSAPATVTITVTGVNDPPTANNDVYVMNEDATLTRNAASGVRSNDTDIEDPTSSLTIVSPELVTVTNGALALSADGSFIYIPRANFSGSDSFTYTVQDTGGLTAVGSVDITINDFNADPTAEDDEFFDISPTGSTALLVLTEGVPDSDQDNDPLSLGSGSDTTSDQGGVVDCTSLTTVCKYTPPADFLGIDSFSYTLSDGAGGSDIGLVTLYVGMPSDCTQEGSNLTGTPGNDVLCGTNGADDIDGKGGDDVILGRGGNDTLRGGDGVDSISGGPGTDTVIHEGTSGPDPIVVSSGGIGFDDIRLVEHVEVRALEGGDAVTVVPSPDTSFELFGGSGFDSLTYQGASLSDIVDTGSRVTATGVQEVVYGSFESVRTDSLLILGDPTAQIFPPFVNSGPAGLRIDLLGGGDTIEVLFGALAGLVEVFDSGADGTDTLRLTGRSSGEVIDVVRGQVGSAGERVTYSDMEHLEVDGDRGDDTIRLDFSAGSAVAAAVPLPEFVLVLGGAGTDLLEVTYDQGCAIDQAASPVSITLDDGTVINLDSTLEGADVVCAGVRTVVSSASGYWMAQASGGISAFGEIQSYGDAPNGDPLASLVNHPANIGVWAVEEDGTVHAFGRATHHGDVDNLNLTKPIVNIASSRTGDGYYLLGGDGGVFAYGDAPFYGSTGAIVLNQPVVAMAANPAGEGYWFTASDGGVFTYGPDTTFHGSVPQALPAGASLARPIVGMAPTATGEGYWMVAADGGIFAFGDAEFYGSVPLALGPGVFPNELIVGIVASPTGKGYWIVAKDGGVFAFGDADFHGPFVSLGVSDMVAFAG
jgi:VCBS repeat-containing protein